MDTRYACEKPDQSYCIYEFMECELNFDCVSCRVANRYWDKMRAQVLESLKKKITSEHENIELVNAPAY